MNKSKKEISESREGVSISMGGATLNTLNRKENKDTVYLQIFKSGKAIWYQMETVFCQR